MSSSTRPRSDSVEEAHDLQAPPRVRLRQISPHEPDGARLFFPSPEDDPIELPRVAETMAASCQLSPLAPTPSESLNSAPVAEIPGEHHFLTDMEQDLYTWTLLCDHFTIAPNVSPNRHAVEWRSHNISSLASSFMGYLVWHHLRGAGHASEDTRPPITERSRWPDMLEGLLYLERRFTLLHSVGNGVERGFYRHLCEHTALNDTQVWRPVSHYLTPIVDHASLTRINPLKARFKAWGTIIISHMVLYALGPFPISPFLVYVLLSPSLEPDFSLDFIAALDPQAATQLGPLFALGPEDVLPTNREDSLVALFYECGFDPARSCDANTHLQMTINIVSFVLFGHATFWQTDPFKALREGADIVLTRWSDKTLLKYIEEQNFDLKCLVRGMYNRDVIDVPFVISRLKFVAQGTSNDTTWQAQDYKLFQLRLALYLLGEGHVVDNSGRVSHEDAKEREGDKSYRCKLLLRAMTDCVLVPSDANWCLTIRFVHADSNHRGAGNAYGFHTCSSAYDIFMTLNIREMLYGPLPILKIQPSQFNEWIHAVLLAQTGYTHV